MKTRTYILKSLAIFMALNILTQILAPTAALALTSGPTTPEVSSFEPVDTTDMVNLVSGDLNYNIPLLEVPGPEGGYPLSLSYHAGVMPSQDASWVGLGWNLNPGSINRTVNNFADDYKNAMYTIADSWVGGVTREYTVGVGLGIGDTPLSVGIDVGVKTDTYKGVGGSFGFNLGYQNDGSPFNAGLSFGQDSWDGSYVSGSVGVGDPKGTEKISGLSAGLSVGYSGGEAYAALGASSMFSQSSMGISMSSEGLKASGRATAVYEGHNNNYGKISTSSGGFGISIPIECFYISVGYKYNRYWMAAQDHTYLYGVLNSKAATDYGSTYWEVDAMRTFDCTVLPDPNASIVDQAAIDWSVNPMIPTYDNYTVLAQGLSGSIEPVILDNGGLFQRQYEEDHVGLLDMKYYFHRRFTKDKHFFRFRNDFSNSHRVTPANFIPTTTPGFTYPTTDLAYTVQDIDPRGYKKTLDGNNKVTEARFAGSKHIEYYTNREINAGTAKANGFIDSRNITASERTKRNFSMGQAVVDNISTADHVGGYDVSDNIGGYSITNESGVTYHYALPAYTYNFYQETNQDGKGKGRTKRAVANFWPYAYTWFLTGITGPDYVDKNDNGLADTGDWGYYLNFDYGRWHHRYGFRTPEVGEIIDIDGARTFSKGFKELYYLNAVSTRTHTALFLKDIRTDAKGLRSSDGDAFTSAPYTTPSGPAYPVDPITCNAYTFVSSLKLSEILLVENTQLYQLGMNWFNGNMYDDYLASIGRVKTGAAPSCFTSGSCMSCTQPTGYGSTFQLITYPTTYCYGDSTVIETRDFSAAALTDFRNKSIKRISFDQDYSLCPNTTNSFVTDPNVKLGKLTLNKIRYYGWNNVQLMPSTNFTYELENPVVDNSMAISATPGETGTARQGRIDMGGANDFQEGDIIKFNAGGKNFYATLIKAIPYYSVPNGLYDVVFLGDVMPGTSDKWVYSSATQTKNPPFTPDSDDLWGSFKSDYKGAAGMKENKKHATTAISAKAVDCWSLRSIESPAGAKIIIDYESDDYNEVVLKNTSIFNFKQNFKVKFNGATDYTGYINGYDKTVYPNKPVEFYFEIMDDETDQSLKNYFKVGDKVSVTTIGEYSFCTFLNCAFAPIEESISNTATVTVVEVNDTSIKLQDLNNQIIAAAMKNGYKYYGDNTTYYVWQWYKHLATYITPSIQSQKMYGGGIRAKSVRVTDGNTVHTTAYTYGSASTSTGSTSFEPNNMNELYIPPNPWPYPTDNYATTPYDAAYDVEINKYKKQYFKSYQNILACAKNIVAPGVLYEQVKVKEYVTTGGVTTEAPAYKSYQFQRYDVNMVTFGDIVPEEPSTTYSYKRTCKINDKTSQLGNLLSIKTYDRNNNLLSKISNTYSNDFDNGQGKIEQVFHSERRMNPDDDHPTNSVWEKKIGVVTVLSDWPSALVSTTEKNYTTGLSTTTNNTAFDFYSGAVTETRTTDPYGNTYISVSDPAYNWYDGMGLKMNGSLSFNMLSQNTGSFLVKQNATPSTYAATVTATGNLTAPNEVLINFTGGIKLPVTCHAGSKLSGLSLPVYVTWISPTRTQCKAISRAATLSSDLGSKSISMDNGDVVSASVTTWSNQWNYRTGEIYSSYSTDAIADYSYPISQYEYKYINLQKWRMKSTYNWNSSYLNAEGNYVMSGVGAFQPFNYNGSQWSTYWQADNTNTLFSIYSKILESKNVNNQYSAIKYSSDQKLICGSATNSRYTEFTINSGEHGEGEFTGFLTTAYSHTGKNSYQLTPSSKIKYVLSYSSLDDAGSSFDKNKSYRLSAWVHKDNIANAQLYYTSTVNGTPTTVTQAYDATTHIKCGNWILMTMMLTTSNAAGTSLSIEVGVKNAGASGNVYADDFRFQPDVSTVTSYVYDPNTGMLNYVLDAANFYTRYEYDSRYKLKATYKETTSGEIKMSEYNYNFGRPIN